MPCLPLPSNPSCSYAPSQSDAGVFAALESAPSAAEYPHAARWYSHIKSWESEFSTLPGDAAAAKSLFGGASASAPAAAEEEDEDDIDLFGSDDEEEDAERERVKAERVAAYNEKKAAKGPAAVGKSVVTMDVKPWDDETDMAELEKSVRSVSREGLVWGASTLVAIGYGVRKLQITLVITDDVSLDEVQEEIAEVRRFLLLAPAPRDHC